jgi:hypothetical protein
LRPQSAHDGRSGEAIHLSQAVIDISAPSGSHGWLSADPLAGCATWIPVIRLKAASGRNETVRQDRAIPNSISPEQGVICLWLRQAT